MQTYLAQGRYDGGSYPLTAPSERSAIRNRHGLDAATEYQRGFEQGRALKRAREAYGTVYGAPGDIAYRHGDTNQPLEMRRKGSKVQFFNWHTSEPVGPEQANVAPATAWALSNGYISPALAALGIFPTLKG
jgi:hypothetical protein